MRYNHWKLSGYKCHPKCIALNYNSNIDWNVVDALKREDVFAEYSAWEFIAYIWYDKKAEIWLGEVWVNNVARATFKSVEPVDLLSNINECFGKGENPVGFPKSASRH